MMGARPSRCAPPLEEDDDEVSFNHFQILRAIGKGSFGKKKDSGALYAMKYMSKQTCVERDELRNVLRELQVLRRIQHPLLANLWFSFQDEEDLFMVVDLLAGGDLRFHLQQNTHFQERTVRLYVCELALALDYLRRSLVIHHDIKPENILLDERGHAHLTDFNVATLLSDSETDSSMAGTRPYMAPEVFLSLLEGAPRYSFAVDWWALGVTAYELLHGSRPFAIRSSSAAAQCLSIIRRQRLRFCCSAGISGLIHSLLTFDPADRPACLSALQASPFLSDVNWDAVLHKSVPPGFTPNKGRLNCDPSFELEEMILESRPLHKKKKRLAKSRATRGQSGSATLIEEFSVFNREKMSAALEHCDGQSNEKMKTVKDSSSEPHTHTHTHTHNLPQNKLK